MRKPRCLLSVLGGMQESPLEKELEHMMGKPVHTLSADGEQAADAGTLLGLKLTDAQINQLADIFADRQVPLIAPMLHQRCSCLCF